MLIDRFRFVLHFGYHSLSVDPILRAADLCTHYLYNIAHVLTAAIFLDEPPAFVLPAGIRICVFLHFC